MLNKRWKRIDTFIDVDLLLPQFLQGIKVSGIQTATASTAATGLFFYMATSDVVGGPTSGALTTDRTTLAPLRLAPRRRTTPASVGTVVSLPCTREATRASALPRPRLVVTVWSSAVSLCREVVVAGPRPRFGAVRLRVLVRPTGRPVMEKIALSAGTQKSVDGASLSRLRPA